MASRQKRRRAGNPESSSSSSAAAAAKRRKPAAPPPPGPIELANGQSDAEFAAAYLQPSHPTWPHWTHPTTHRPYALDVVRADGLGAADLQACFALVEETSRADYAGGGERGWRPAEKLAEMRDSPGLRYVLVREEWKGEGVDEEGKEEGGEEKEEGPKERNESGEGKEVVGKGESKGAIRGFTSLMPTYEAGRPVVYCYEIHLKPELQSTGLGQLLLSLHSAVAARIPTIDGVMLTCFVSNARALAFYRRQGFRTDATSPRPRRLRSGKEVVPGYVILSKTVEAAAAPSTAS